MLKINLITRLYDLSPLYDTYDDKEANSRLVRTKFGFNISYLRITEEDFMLGERDSSLHLKILDANQTEQPHEGLFIYHGVFPTSASHLFNHRYISLIDKNIHFLTVWSSRLNNYCELFINDYSNETCKRYII